MAFVVLDEVDAWPAIRALRSSRPELAARGARARTFSAGLEQAEQLWKAAESVGPVASPLLLFYGLTQAGRAICAAGIEENGWRNREGHGLTFDCDRAGGGGERMTLDRVRVEPSGNGLVQQVARALDSPVLTIAADLDELICGLISGRILSLATLPRPRPLEVGLNIRSMNARGTAIPSLVLAPVPQQLIEFESVPAGPNHLAYRRTVSAPPEAIAAWIAPYPTLAALGRPTNAAAPEATLDKEKTHQLRVRWPDSAVAPDVNQWAWTKQHLDVIWGDGGQGSGFMDGLVLPAIGGNDRAQTPLITWWLVLYALSMLARYYPNEWTALLDVDNHLLAVPLAHLPSTAAEQVPVLILSALATFGG